MCVYLVSIVASKRTNEGTITIKSYIMFQQCTRRCGPCRCDVAEHESKV